MKKKRTVGFIILTNIPDPVGTVAILQTRGKFNYEKRSSETYAGATQISVHGSIEGDESEFEALVRETREELGEEFANLVQGRSLDLIKLNGIENENISIVNFDFRIAEKDLEKIKLDERTVAKIRLITKNDIVNIRELKPSERLTGIDKNEIAMFPDDIEAVKLAFEKLNTGKGLSSRKSIFKEE
jgi:hypothetical protein